jgi:hypothetical protein
MTPRAINIQYKIYICFFILYIQIPIDIPIHIRIVNVKHLGYDISNDQYIQLHTK